LYASAQLLEQANQMALKSHSTLQQKMGTISWSKIKENRDLGKSEIREVMMVADNLKIQEKEAAVRMWCDGLRLRG
jgi:hypothetical protein